jgi:hypothetical protein
LRISGSGGEVSRYLGERQRRLVDQFIGHHVIEPQQDGCGVELLRLENSLLPGDLTKIDLKSKRPKSRCNTLPNLVQHAALAPVVFVS